MLSAYNDEKAAGGLRPRFFVRNYGCQMNERDAEKLRALLAQLGYDAAPTEADADLILYNTCCVRESAEDKIYGHLSRLKTRKATNPELFIVVCGCMSQRAEVAETFRGKHKYINVVCGTANRHRLPDFIWQALQTGRQVVDISEDDGVPELIDVPVTTREYPHKAGVNIMYGCDNFCSFCIVPHVRGREKSRAVAEILAEVRALVDDGVKEIMLLGQNVNAYRGEITFAELLRRVHDENPSLARIRFMTSHPKDFSDDLIAAVRDLPRVCKSVHLPLQSGATRVLEDMNRHYTQTQYLELCAKLQSAIPGIGITTDIIVAYPGETDEDFEETLHVVETVRYASAFTFIYSKRSGTPAADRTDTIPRKTANERFERLTATLYPIMAAHNEARIGQTVQVMVEEAPDAEGKGGKGRTDDNILVHFNYVGQNTPAPGDIVCVQIDAARSFYMSGEA
ncbi:MAG: tRNA (N6-isopentenyl adenosine(37)-C2)-methylthiotransferase MiaB [Defluviitaleaceae bacterium]|nr:tRNA (N6-isopentenyl adenosine(37)-C2)-methylthiotransferase MiaB [Defluviitaleaceae bacterium]